jgi:multimeric flavodoxin WrbA
MRNCANAEMRKFSRKRHQMKAVGIVGSPRKEGNTEILVAHCLKAIAAEGMETELIRLAGLKIAGCNACRYCFEHPDECSIEDDFQKVDKKMRDADIIIVGSPVYCGSATSLVKGLLERSSYMSRTSGAYAGKVGGPITVARRAGQNFTFAELLFWFHINGMVNPGATYWNVAIGREKGEAAKDEEGMTTVWNFGNNCARVAKKLRG